MRFQSIKEGNDIIQPQRFHHFLLKFPKWFPLLTGVLSNFPLLSGLLSVHMQPDCVRTHVKGWKGKLLHAHAYAHNMQAQLHVYTCKRIHCGACLDLPHLAIWSLNNSFNTATVTNSTFYFHYIHTCTMIFLQVNNILYGYMYLIFSQCKLLVSV